MVARYVPIKDGTFRRFHWKCAQGGVGGLFTDAVPRQGTEDIFDACVLGQGGVMGLMSLQPCFFCGEVGKEYGG